MLPSLTKDEQKRNRITSIMQIAISVGVFGVYAAVPNLVGAFEGVSAQTIYGIIAIVVTSLYLVSQILLVVGCKERDRSEDVDKPDDVKFSDMIKLFKKNDQFRVNIIAILLNYLGSGVLVGFAMYYFYLMFGYGAEAGGNIQFIFTIMYAVGTLLSQIAYPLLSKFLTRKKIFITSGICLLLGYTLFFIMGMPLFGKYALAVSHSWALIVMYASAVILFFGQG
jgi:melibiose permease/lactose/raffinose/galactose permease